MLLQIVSMRNLQFPVIDNNIITSDYEIANAENQNKFRRFKLKNQGV